MLDIHINQQHIKIPQAVLQSHNINANDKYDVQFQGQNIVLVPVFESFINSHITKITEVKTEKKVNNIVEDDDKKLSVSELIEAMDFKTDKCLTIEEMNEGLAKGFANWKNENL